MSDFDDREQAAYERTVELFRTAPADARVADGTWTVRDVLARLVTVARRYTSMPRLADTPRGVDAINAEELADPADAGVDELLAFLREVLPAYGRTGCAPVSVGLALDGCEPWTLVVDADGVRTARLLECVERP